MLEPWSRCNNSVTGQKRAARIYPSPSYHRFGSIVFGSLLACAVCLGDPGDAVASDDIGIPSELSDADVKRYKSIFAEQQKGRIAAADRLIRKLDNRLLMGHVLFERYMHPTAYRSKFRELRDWLKQYRDHPEAERIYRLALRRRPKAAHYPPPPYRKLAIPGFQSPRPAKRKRAQAAGPPKGRNARYLYDRIRKYVRKREAARAEKILNRADTKKYLSPRHFDEARGQVATAYFHLDKNQKAFDLATASAARSREKLYWPDWIAGLAAWRLHQFEAAALHFQAVHDARNAGRWKKSSAAFWLARSHLLSGRHDQVTRWLRRAAAHPLTFYGLIAARILGEDKPLNLAPPPLGEADLKRLMTSKAVRRAIALSEAGRHELADMELEAVYWASWPGIVPAMLGLTYRLNLPSLSYRIAARNRRRLPARYDLALYPIPPWRPRSGFQINPALIYAFMRQESQFDPDAKSRAGARGLMQLMPTTARYISGEKHMRRDRLFDPGYNLELGQKYLRYLLANGMVKGNLFKLTVAYNAGPGNLQNWQKLVDVKDDPLMFAESLPSGETRVFIERVMANYWIYQLRMGRPAGSLDQVAAGAWPLYRAAGKAAGQLARTEWTE